MSAENVQDIIKRYNFTSLATTAWQDPQASVLPYRGGPKYTVSPKAVAGSYQPTYRYPIKPPKPPTPSEVTDDEESDGNDDATGDVQDPVATSSPEEVLFVDVPETPSSNEDLQPSPQPDEPTVTTEQAPSTTVTDTSEQPPPSVEEETPTAEAAPPPEDPAKPVDEPSTEKLSPADQVVAIEVDASLPTSDETENVITQEESGANESAEAGDQIITQDQKITASTDTPTDVHAASSDEADFATFTLEDVQQPQSSIVDNGDGPPSPAPDPPTGPSDASVSPSEDVVLVPVAPPSPQMDKKVSFAPETLDPKSTSRKKKSSAKDITKTKKKKSSAEKSKPSPDDVVTIVVEGAESTDTPLPLPPPSLPEVVVPEAVVKLEEDESAAEVAEHSEPSVDAAADLSKASEESHVNNNDLPDSVATSADPVPDDNQPPQPVESSESNNIETSKKVDDECESAPTPPAVVPENATKDDADATSHAVVSPELGETVIENVLAEQPAVVEEALQADEETDNAPAMMVMEDAPAPAHSDADAVVVDDDIVVVMPPLPEAPSKSSKKKSAKSAEKENDGKKMNKKTQAKTSEEPVIEKTDNVTSPAPPPPQEQPNEVLEIIPEADNLSEPAAVEVVDGGASNEPEVVVTPLDDDEPAGEANSDGINALENTVGNERNPASLPEPPDDNTESQAKPQDVPPPETDTTDEHRETDVAGSDTNAVVDASNDEPVASSENESTAIGPPAPDSVLVENPKVEPVEGSTAEVNSEGLAEVVVGAMNEDNAGAKKTAECDEATQNTVEKGSADDVAPKSGETDSPVAIEAVAAEHEAKPEENVVVEESKIAEPDSTPAASTADESTAPDTHATDQKSDDASPPRDEPAIDAVDGQDVPPEVVAEPVSSPPADDQAAILQVPEMATDAVEESAEPQQTPAAPPSPALSKSSSKRPQEGWTRHSKKSHDRSRALEPTDTKRSSRSGRTESGTRDGRHRPRRYSMTPEEEAERRRRHQERRERKAAEEAERERSKVEKEQKRKLQKKIDEAMIKAAADETRKLVREREDEKKRRRRRDSVLKEVDSPRLRKDNTEREVDLDSPKDHRPTLSKSLKDTNGESFTRAGLLVRTSDDGYRMSGESTRRQRRESQPSSSPLLQETSRSGRDERPRRSHAFSGSRHERSEKHAAPSSSRNAKAESNSSRHSSRRLVEATPEDQRDRPHRSRRESGRRERRPSVMEKEKKTSFFGSLMKAFK